MVQKNLGWLNKKEGDIALMYKMFVAPHLKKNAEF